jgi:hypothetical protein
MDLPADGRHVYLSVVATNDSINSSPNLKVSRLFGNPSDNSEWQPFVPPGRLTMMPDPNCIAPKPADVAESQADHKDNKAEGQNKDQDKDKDKQKKPTPAAPAAPCGYVISGAAVEAMSLVEDTTKTCKVHLDNTGAYERNVRVVKADKCARQVALRYESQWNQQAFLGEIVLSIPAKPAAAATPPADTTPGDGPTPHFQLVRSGPIASSSAGLATVTVGIQNLKDQTATVSVQNADIVTATDGSQNALAIQAGNQVIVAQDTNIFLQVRNFAPKGFNVQAEGKNGTASAGKLKFINNFTVTKEAATGGTMTAKSTGGAGK